jgi:branched-chain amino acid transport system permease protein
MRAAAKNCPGASALLGTSGLTVRRAPVLISHTSLDTISPANMRPRRRPELRVYTELILQAIVTGILLGGVYSLICVGLTLTFGVMRIINFAHGEFLMVAMYGTYFFTQAFHTESYFAVIAMLPGLFLFGIFVFHLLVRPILGAEPLNQMLLLVGLSLVLQNGALALFSPDTRSVQSALAYSKIEFGDVIVSMPKLIACVVSVAITLALYWLLQFTELGRRIRAAASDRETAALMGINVNRVNLLAFGIGVGSLGIAGPVMMPIFYIVPNIGSFFILIAFVVVVLGGIGNFMGALFASFIVAIAESLGALFMPGSTAPVLPFLLFILVLLFKPEGLFAAPAR